MVTFALPESPASGASGQLVSDQEAISPRQERQEQQHRPSTPYNSPPRFIFNKEKVRDTWRAPVANANNQIRIVIERDGYANGEIVCDRIDPDLLFKSVPALRKCLEDRRIFLPASACLDEAIVESMVCDLVCCAKDGIPIPVPDHVMRDPVSMISMHCVVVFFELKQEAEEFRNALWKLFASLDLNHSDMLWIWDTFSGHVRSDPYTAPFADEYVQMMAWRILTLDANRQLDQHIHSQIESEKEPKYLTEILKTRLKTHGLEMDPLGSKASKEPSQPWPMASTNEMNSGNRESANMMGSAALNHTEQDSGRIYNSATTLDMGQQDLVITPNAGGQDTKADPCVKAGMKRPSSTNDATGDQKRVMIGSDESQLAPSTSSFNFNSNGVTKPGMSAMASVPTAGSSAIPMFNRASDLESAQSASLGIGPPVSSSAFHMFGKSGQGPAQSVIDLNPAPEALSPFGTARQVIIQPDSMDTTTTDNTAAAALSSKASATNRFRTSTTPLPNSGFRGPFGSDVHSFGASAAATTNSLSTDPAQKRMQMQQASSLFAATKTPNATLGPPQNTRSRLFGTPAPNAPGTGIFNTSLGSSMNNAGTFGVTGNHASTLGATSNPFASSNPNALGQGLTHFTTSVNTDFSGQSQPANANLFPNAGFGTTPNNPNQGGNPFIFRPSNRSGSGSGARNNGGRIIKHATGTRGGRRQG